MACPSRPLPLMCAASLFAATCATASGGGAVRADDGPGTIRLVDLLDVATIEGPLVEIEPVARIEDFEGLRREPLLAEDFEDFDAREAGWSRSPQAEVAEVEGGRAFVLHRMGRSSNYGWVFPVEPGQQYVFRRSIRCDRAPDADFAVVESKASGRIGLRGPFDNHYMAGRGLALKIHWPEPPATDGEWHDGAVSFFTTPQTRALAVMMRPTLSPQSATQRESDAWFDDVHLDRVDPTPEQRIALFKSQSLASGADPALGVHKHGQFPPLGEVGDSYGPGDENYSYREALYAPAPTVMAFPVQVPAAASLRFAAALSRETRAGDGAHFEVSVRHGGEERALWTADIKAEGAGWRWHEQRVDLAEYAGREVEVVLSTTALKGHPQAVWGSPMIDVAASEDSPRNVILIAVDTLRADRLSCYGYERETTPNLDALAADGVRFDQATSNCNWTCPSFASIFTGVVPSRHGVFSYGPRTPLPDEFSTIAERFREAGWPTNSIAYKPPLYDGNFEQGFDVAFNVPRENVVGEDNLREALEWLDANADRRNFLFLHFNDPHQPFTQPAPFDSKFGSDPAEYGLEIPFSLYGGGMPRGEEGRQLIRDLYDGAVAYVDDRIGVFLDALREKGLYEDSVIAFVADHGEQLWEHGGFGHGPTFALDANLLFDEVVHVPLIVKPAGGKIGNVVQSQVRGFDVMPTLLELAGLSVGDGLDAESLVPLFGADLSEVEDRIAVTETSGRALALRNRHWKYILNYSRGARESLYDLKEDAAEKRNVASEHPEVLATMRQQAMEYILLRRPGHYLIATGEVSDDASLQLQGARSAVSLFGLPSRPEEDGGLRFSGAAKDPLWVVAELEVSGTPTIVGQESGEPPLYREGQLSAMLESGEPQALLVSGPPRVAPASRARRTMDARQLEALKALGYIDDGEEGSSAEGGDDPVEEVSIRSAAQPVKSVVRSGRPGEIAIGERLGSSRSLRDLRGNRRSISDLEGHRALAIVFLGTECPLANLYVPRLRDLAEQFGDQGVRFLGVYPHASETLPEVAAHASDRDLPFLIVKDFGQKLADTLGIERTPAVAVLDADGALRYRGRIDDQYSVAARREAPKNQELAQALEQLLAGEEVTVAETDEDGCLLDRPLSTEAGEAVTFTRDVAPILQARCEVCHREGQIGGFALQTYDDATRRRRMLREVVAQRRMPPWHADDRYGHFANDRSLSEEEIDALCRWVDQGAVRGDPADLPAPREWSGDWNLGDPDLVMEIPRAIDVPADGFMDYVYQTVKTDFDEDLWVQDAEIRPGDPSVLHHVLVYIQPPNAGRGFDRTTMALVNWVPGTMPKRNPPGSATRIPKGSTLLWELHYTPNGTATTDRTSMALKLADEPPELETQFSIWANWRIRIPPRAGHHEERASLRIREDTHLISFRPHMHMRGKTWRYEADFPDGRSETLLNVPNWDFNWQTEYFLEEPLPLPRGTVLRSIARWDNSDENPLNPDPSKTVGYGLQTYEEMMNGWVKLAPVRRPTESAGPQDDRSELVAQAVFDSVDADGDGKISAQEWTANERVRPWFESKGIELKLPSDFGRFLAVFPADQ